MLIASTRVPRWNLSFITSGGPHSLECIILKDLIAKQSQLPHSLVNTIQLNYSPKSNSVNANTAGSRKARKPCRESRQFHLKFSIHYLRGKKPFRLDSECPERESSSRLVDKWDKLTTSKPSISRKLFERKTVFPLPLHRSGKRGLDYPPFVEFYFWRPVCNSTLQMSGWREWWFFLSTLTGSVVTVAHFHQICIKNDTFCLNLHVICAKWLQEK